MLGEMTYTVKLFNTNGDSDGDAGPGLCAAQRRFQQVLEATLGDSSLVLPVYEAYRRIAAAYGDPPAVEALTDAEREIVQQWQEAESAAITAVYGPMRGMGDGFYELVALAEIEAPSPTSAD
jgi:hypothetical protein